MDEPEFRRDAEPGGRLAHGYMDELMDTIRSMGTYGCVDEPGTDMSRTNVVAINQKNAPRRLSLEGKRQFYLAVMYQLDMDNNKLKDQILLMSSYSHEEKDNDFHWCRKIYVLQLERGRAAREFYRLRVRRLKETIKNRNRSLSGNIPKETP